MSAPTICRYCNKVELVFDNSFKSKTGKLIPLDKTSGVPHQCPDNPYPYSKSQQQQQQPQPQVQQLPQPQQQPDLFLEVKLLSQKVDKLLVLLTEVKGNEY